VASAHELAERIPGAEYQELTGAGHGYVMERPDDAIARLLGFIRDSARR
jgi:pimeloyl-ACP methyl ester carboxylesterase